MSSSSEQLGALPDVVRQLVELNGGQLGAELDTGALLREGKIEGHRASLDQLFGERVDGFESADELGDLAGVPTLWKSVVELATKKGTKVPRGCDEGNLQRCEVEPETGLLAVPWVENECGAVLLCGISGAGSSIVNSEDAIPDASARLRCVAVVAPFVRAPRGCAVLHGSGIPFTESLQQFLGGESAAKEPNEAFNGAATELSGAREVREQCLALRDPGDSLLVMVIENGSHQCSIWRVVFPSGLADLAAADPREVLVFREHLLGEDAKTRHNFPQDASAMVDPRSGRPIFAVANGAANNVVIYYADTAEMVSGGPVKSGAGWPWAIGCDPTTGDVYMGCDSGPRKLIYSGEEDYDVLTIPHNIPTNAHVWCDHTGAIFICNQGRLSMVVDDKTSITLWSTATSGTGFCYDHNRGRVWICESNKTLVAFGSGHTFVKAARKR